MIYPTMRYYRHRIDDDINEKGASMITSSVVRMTAGVVVLLAAMAIGTRAEALEIPCFDPSEG